MKPLVYSYTFLNTYEICPHQAYRRFVLKDIPFVETEAMKWGTEVHKAFEKRIGVGTAFPHGMEKYEPFGSFFVSQKAAPEMQVAMTREGQACAFFAKDVYIRGKIDINWLPSHDTAFIADVKTGKPREEPLELKLFGLMLHALHPQLTSIRGRYLWLKDMRIGKEHDLSDTASTWADLQARTNTIENYAKLDHWPKRQSPLCGWCSVSDCEFNPEFKK